jgi:hypothetical protein
VQYTFSEDYEYLLSKALSRTGIIKVKDEGEIDVEDIDINTMQQIIWRGESIAEFREEKGFPKLAGDRMPDSFAPVDTEKKTEEPKLEDSKTEEPKKEEPAIEEAKDIPGK